MSNTSLPVSNFSLLLNWGSREGSNARNRDSVMSVDLRSIRMDASQGIEEAVMPKTRYQHLQDAGDSCDSLVKQLLKAGEEDFAREAQQLLNRLWAAQEESWDAVRDGVDEYEEVAWASLLFKWAVSMIFFLIWEWLRRK